MSEQQTDPYAAYGGQVASGGGADPYAAYGGSVAASAEKSLWRKAKDNFNANTQHVPTTGIKSVVQNFGAGGGDVIRSISHALDKQPEKSLDQQYADAQQNMDKFAADPVAGYASAAGQAGTGLLLGAATGAAAGKVISSAAKLAGPPPSVSGQNYATPHAQAFEGAIAPATAMGKNFVPQNVTPEALTPIRSTAARMAQGTPVEQGVVRAATSSKTPPLERLGAYQHIVQSALDDLEAQHAPALAQSSNVPVDTASIVRRLKSQISPTMAPADVSAINELASRVQQAKTIGDLNRFRQELNTETSPEYRQSQVQAGRSGVSSQTTSDLAGWVRNAYYDNLQQATGKDFAPLKRQEANLITTQEALQNQQAPLAKAEATHNAPATLRETAGNIANVVKDPKTTVTQTILRESPATKVATLLKKSLDDLPDHTPPPAPPPPPSRIGAQPPQPMLGKGPIPTAQATPVNPFPGPSPRGLPAPSPTPAAPQPQLPAYRQPGQLGAGPNTLQLPATTEGRIPTPASPPPPFNPDAARMRVQPTQFAQPEATPSRGPIHVSPAGDATPPIKGLLPEAAAPKAVTPTGKALWAQRGAGKMATHGVSASDLEALAKTAKGKQLLVIASDLTPGSPAMKNLVQQIPAALGK